MALANRAQMSIFDLLSVLPVVRLDVHKLLSFLGPRMNRQRSTAKVPPVISLGRNMLRASGDDDDEEVVDQAPRPGYLTDIYPPLPRAYTYRRTEVITHIPAKPSFVTCRPRVFERAIRC